MVPWVRLVLGDLHVSEWMAGAVAVCLRELIQHGTRAVLHGWGGTVQDKGKSGGEGGRHRAAGWDDLQQTMRAADVSRKRARVGDAVAS